MATIDNTTSNSSNMNVREYLLGINELNRPKTVDMSIIKPNTMNSAIILITRLIYLKKGSAYPDFPDAGIDIIKRYRFAYEEELPALARDLEEQISTYLPEFLPVSVSVGYAPNSEGKNKIQIKLDFNDTEFMMVYDTSTYSLDALQNMT